MKIKKLLGGGIAAGALTLSSIGGAGAAVTFDPATGYGFVGKGDVQLAFGWNNKAMQDNQGDVTFQYQASSVEVTEVSWTCTNTKNDTTQERERTTTTTSSKQGVVSKLARIKNQMTGYDLMGYAGDPTVTESSTTDGPTVNSCPSGFWVLSAAAGDPEVVSSTTTGGLYAIHGGNSVQIQ